jgi:hypothetical protein
MNCINLIINAFLLVSVLSLFFACGNSPKSDSKTEVTFENAKGEKYSDLKFSEDFFDFGSIVQGEVVSHTFHFHNDGNDVLIIKDLIPDCGCTEPKIEKKSLKPGEESSVEVIFNSKGWAGSQYKSVTLRTNSPNREKSVTIKANVVPAKE